MMTEYIGDPDCYVYFDKENVLHNITIAGITVIVDKEQLEKINEVTSYMMERTNDQ